MDPLKLWNQIGGVYLQRSVQRRPFAEEERLSPLVGLASCLQPYIGKRFTAGLWTNNSEDMARELMWHIGASLQGGDGPSRRRVDRGDGFTPSWSWVSMMTRSLHQLCSADDMFLNDGEAVLRFRADRDFLARKIRSVKPEGIAPKLPDEHWFHADCGELDLSGKLAEGKVDAHPYARLYPFSGVYRFIAASADADRFPPTTEDPPSVFELPKPPSSTQETLGSAAEGDVVVVGGVMMDCDYYDQERIASAEGEEGFTRAHFLLLGRLEWRKTLETRRFPNVDVGLVLRKVGDDESNGFERIGVFWRASGRDGMFDEAVRDIVLV